MCKALHHKGDPGVSGSTASISKWVCRQLSQGLGTHRPNGTVVAPDQSQEGATGQSLSLGQVASPELNLASRKWE